MMYHLKVSEIGLKKNLQNVARYSHILAVALVMSQSRKRLAIP